VQPVFADFTALFVLPEHLVTPSRNLVFFPGSTIGNFTRDEARELLGVRRIEARDDGALLIGVDLRKDQAVLHAAYNDSAGVTAEFNLNVLRRLNRELGADFRLDAFEHHAVYDEAEGRVEMRLVSTRPQSVTIAGETVRFGRGEYVITEYSHKYSVEEFAALARTAGLRPERAWTDAEDLFSLHYLTVD
jgi:dimethylhistidine N-methyltransferase